MRGRVVGEGVRHKGDLASLAFTLVKWAPQQDFEQSQLSISKDDYGTMLRTD